MIVFVFVFLFVIVFLLVRLFCLLVLFCVLCFGGSFGPEHEAASKGAKRNPESRTSSETWCFGVPFLRGCLAF